MSGKTRAQLIDEVGKCWAEIERLRALVKGRDALQAECDALRDQVHGHELTIAHMRGRLSVLDAPSPVEAPTPPAVIPPNVWDTPLPWDHLVDVASHYDLDKWARGGHRTLTVADQPPTPWWRRR